MPVVPLRVAGDGDDVFARGFAAIREELSITTAHPDDAAAEAEAAVRAGPSIAATTDLRHLPFVTVDPAGSRDLDQAVAIEAEGRGFVVHYAIADVAAFVRPGGPLDREAHRRAVTIYLPDEKAPLHPPVLSEGAASLLTEQDRQALVWRIQLNADGEPTDVSMARATVRSRGAFTYDEVQALVDSGRADGTFALLRDVGLLREAREADRGGVSLPLPDQVVERDADRFAVVYRAPLPVEGWNAQISLLAGMEAGRIMLAAGVGVLRTLPAAGAEAIASFTRRARALGISAPASSYSALIRSLDPSLPAHAALLVQAARLLRGAGYAAFDGEPPAEPVHAAVAAPYAHVTAPLRRLVDRFGNEIVLAAIAGKEPPSWARDGLAALPAAMADGRRREGSADRMAVDLVEAVVLGARAGEVLRGVVVDASHDRVVVQLHSPAVVAAVAADPAPQLGEEVAVEVVGADVEARRVELRVSR